MDKLKLEILYLKNKYGIWYKLVEKITPFISLAILLTVFIGYLGIILNYSFIDKKIVFLIGIFILAYFIWWIIRGFEIIIFTIKILNIYFKNKKINYSRILSFISTDKKEIKLQNLLKKQHLKPNQIIHWLIIPTYKESFEILDQTIQSILKSDYPFKQNIAISIAGEEADKENFLKIISKLKTKYQNKFSYFNHTIHTLQPNELPGKGANIKFHAKTLYKDILAKFDTTPNKILVTTLDADTNIDKNYLSVLTYEYITTPNRQYVAYQPLILFFNNFWESPFFSKIVGLSNSFWILFNGAKKFGVRNFSTHAQPLDTLIELDFWSNQTIVEDGHQYRRSYFGLNGNYWCKFIPTNVYQDNNLNINILETAKAQYKQMRRWAHGVEDIPYTIFSWIENFKNIPKFRTLYEILKLIEGHITWATLHIILSIGLIFTFIKDIPLNSFITLGNTISIFTGISILMLIFVILLQVIFTPWYKIKNTFKKIYLFGKFFILYIIFLGPSLVIFSGLPALHTQIMILLGKPMKKFNVTIKIRKND